VKFFQQGDPDCHRDTNFGFIDEVVKSFVDSLGEQRCIENLSINLPELFWRQFSP
jgi:hypothetical protein